MLEIGELTVNLEAKMLAIEVGQAKIEVAVANLARLSDEVFLLWTPKKPPEVSLAPSNFSTMRQTKARLDFAMEELCIARRDNQLFEDRCH